MIDVGDLSPHFSTHEFVDRRTGHFVRPPQELLAVLELVRGLAGRPVHILSGHRCPSTNELVGGALHSRHIVGDAVDIMRGLVTVRQAIACGAVGVGERSGWAVHLDVRPGPVVRWRY